MIGNRLKIARITYDNVTQADLAGRIGCSRQTINSIENCKFTPSVELALKIARELEMKVEEIFFIAETCEEAWGGEE
ncbi:MAG: helix-turn-helix transcriptional regulator [bacterium]|nr:helix-turn-helix transcriptional regulator [bacterium]